jgi:hypothetical protein
MLVAIRKATTGIPVDTEMLSTWTITTTGGDRHEADLAA